MQAYRSCRDAERVFRGDQILNASSNGKFLASQMLNERSRLRRLLTARGDYWDLTWDLQQLERAWRNEVVTIPVCQSFPTICILQPLRTNPYSEDTQHVHCDHETRNQHWNFIPKSVSVPVPQAKVYLRDKIDEDPPYPIPIPANERGVNDPYRYHVFLTILAFEEAGAVPYKSVESSLFVVKGNPLMVTSSPLPCFASGVNEFLIDVRPNDDISNLYVQAIVNNFGAHMAVPLDEVLEYAKSLSKAPIERTITMWDVQTGRMRGSALVQLSVEKEEPHSYSEIISIRKSLTQFPPPLQATREDTVDTFSSTRGAAGNGSAFSSSSSSEGIFHQEDEQRDSLERQRMSIESSSRRLSQINALPNSVPSLDLSTLKRSDTVPQPAVVGQERRFSFGQPVAVSPTAKSRSRGGVQGFAVKDTSSLLQEGFVASSSVTPSVVQLSSRSNNE